MIKRILAILLSAVGIIMATTCVIALTVIDTGLAGDFLFGVSSLCFAYFSVWMAEYAV